MDDDIWGVCNVCKKPVTIWERDERAHGCKDYHVDASWQALANPENTPWVPGYRFFVEQYAQKQGRTRVHSRPRRYKVMWQINRDGHLEWNGGVKPTPETQAEVEALYASERPGSNGGPA